MTTLRKAIEQNKLDQFIAEHEGETGDAEALEETIQNLHHSPSFIAITSATKQTVR